MEKPDCAAIHRLCATEIDLGRTFKQAREGLGRESVHVSVCE